MTLSACHCHAISTSAFKSSTINYYYSTRLLSIMQEVAANYNMIGQLMVILPV